MAFHTFLKAKLPRLMILIVILVGLSNLSPSMAAKKRVLNECSDSSAEIKAEAISQPVEEGQDIVVTVSGLTHPSDKDWVAMISPSSTRVDEYCEPDPAKGDLDDIPSRCPFVLQASYLRDDPQYRACTEKCFASLTFQAMKSKGSDIEFRAYLGLGEPCVLISQPLQIAQTSSRDTGL